MARRTHKQPESPPLRVKTILVHSLKQVKAI